MSGAGTKVKFQQVSIDPKAKTWRQHALCDDPTHDKLFIMYIFVAALHLAMIILMVLVDTDAMVCETANTVAQLYDVDHAWDAATMSVVPFIASTVTHLTTTNDVLAKTGGHVTTLDHDVAGNNETMWVSVRSVPVATVDVAAVILAFLVISFVVSVFSLTWIRVHRKGKTPSSSCCYYPASEAHGYGLVHHARWLDYFLTAPLMIFLIAYYAGVATRCLLASLTVMCAISMLAGPMIAAIEYKEVETPGSLGKFGSWMRVVVFTVSCLIQVFIWVIIWARVASLDPPDFVYGIVATECVLFLSFAIVQFTWSWRKMCGLGKTTTQRYDWNEYAFAILGATSKIILSAMLYSYVFRDGC
jgi:hypothetical protein